jgi:hypothetical protein
MHRGLSGRGPDESPISFHPHELGGDDQGRGGTGNPTTLMVVQALEDLVVKREKKRGEPCPKREKPLPRAGL